MTTFALYAYYSPNIIYFGDIVVTDENLNGVSLGSNENINQDAEEKDQNLDEISLAPGEPTDQSEEKEGNGITCLPLLPSFKKLSPSDPCPDYKFTYNVKCTGSETVSSDKESEEDITDFSLRETVFISCLGATLKAKDKNFQKGICRSKCGLRCIAELKEGVITEPCEIDNSESCSESSFKNACKSSGVVEKICICDPIVDIDIAASDPHVPGEEKPKGEGQSGTGEEQGGGTTVGLG